MEPRHPQGKIKKAKIIVSLPIEVIDWLKGQDKPSEMIGGLIVAQYEFRTCDSLYDLMDELRD